MGSDLENRSESLSFWQLTESSTLVSGIRSWPGPFHCDAIEEGGWTVGFGGGRS